MGAERNADPADNNGYGLKVFALLRLAGVPFRHEHIFDASAAPRGQLPYIVDDGETIGDSDTIIAHLVAKARLTIDDALTAAQRDTGHLITRMLDDLYWVMSYSRWKDERFWPLFRDAITQVAQSYGAGAMCGRWQRIDRRFPASPSRRSVTAASQKTVTPTVRITSRISPRPR